MDLIFRQGSLFIIDETKLSEKAKTPETKNALYAAIYDEFKGAVQNKLYKNLTYSERLNRVNKFAKQWLDDRGLS